MTTQRSEPGQNADERTMLEGWLDYHRATLAWKCEGLTDEQLRTASVAPSELSLMGLVRHMAEVERSWFRRVFAGEDAGPIYFGEADPDGEFHPGEADTWQDAYETWQAEIEAAGATRQAIPSTSAPRAVTTRTPSRAPCAGSTRT